MDNNPPQQKSLEEFNKVIEQKQRKTPFVWPYVIGSFVIPPFTLIAMLIITWRRKILYLFLPTVTMANSVLSGFFVFESFSSLLPILNLYNALEKPQPSNTQALFIASISIFFIILGIIFGFIFRRKAIKNYDLTNFEKAFLFAILIIQYLLDFLMLVSVNSYIYNLPTDF